MSRLTDKEQRHVRTALRFLRFQCGSWKPIARALKSKPDTLRKIARARRVVTPALAVAVARLVDAPAAEVLDGTWISPRTCPHCGHPPDDFQDEEPVVEGELRGLTVLDGGKK